MVGKSNKITRHFMSNSEIGHGVAVDTGVVGLAVEGWKVVVKMGEKRGGVVRWELIARPPGVAGERGVRMISGFETEVGGRKEEWARALLGCVERLLDRVARSPGV